MPQDIDAVDFDPYHLWLGIPAKHQPASHYRLLGIEEFESDARVIDDAAERQIAHVRRKSLGQHTQVSQKILNELARAKVCLLDPAKKSAYDNALRIRSLPPAIVEAGPPVQSIPLVGNDALSLEDPSMDPNRYSFHFLEDGTASHSETTSNIIVASNHSRERHATHDLFRSGDDLLSRLVGAENELLQRFLRFMVPIGILGAIIIPVVFVGQLAWDYRSRWQQQGEFSVEPNLPSQKPDDENAGGGLPIFADIRPQRIEEGVLWKFPTIGGSAGREPIRLEFGLDSTNVPQGVEINRATGVITWTPSESQGPGNYTITVIAKRNDSASETLERMPIKVEVLEINEAPMLRALETQRVQSGKTLTFSLIGSDADVPSNALRYEMMNNPSGSSLDRETGTFVWKPDANQIGKSYSVDFLLKDHGSPPLQSRQIVLMNAYDELRISPVQDVDLVSGEKRKLEIKVDRRGNDGPIVLSVDGLPDKVTVQPVVIPLQNDVAILELSALPSAADAKTRVRLSAIASSLASETGFLVTVSKPGNSQPFQIDMRGWPSLEPLRASKVPPRWRAQGVFARIMGKGDVTFPANPRKEFIFEAEIELLDKQGKVLFRIGDQSKAYVELSVGPNWDSDKGKDTYPCRLFKVVGGTYYWLGESNYRVGERLYLRLEVKEGRQTLFQDGKRVLSADASSPNLALQVTGDDHTKAVIYRCAFRPLNDN